MLCNVHHTVELLLNISLIATQSRNVSSKQVMQLLRLCLAYIDCIMHSSNAAKYLTHLLEKQMHITVTHVGLRA